jgi:nifR3 family TIM-barrel protein
MGRKNIWHELKARAKPFFVLAPMADVTDLPFRQTIRTCGSPDLWYTEFVSADGLLSRGKEKLLPLLGKEDADHPIIAQFFGANPEHISGAARIAKEMGFDGVDINMGCPERKIVKQGAGIALSGSPDRAKEIILAAKEGAGDLPVSVKTRLGRYQTDEMEEWIGMLLECPIDALIIHGRTMKEMSKVPAHWDLIKQAVTMAKGTNVVIVGNGDIESREEGEEKARASGVDGVMVGRGIFKNPWLFGDKKEIPPRERIETFTHHTERFHAYWGDRKPFDYMKKFAKAYIEGFDGAKEARKKIMDARGYDATKEAIREIAREY